MIAITSELQETKAIVFPLSQVMTNDKLRLSYWVSNHILKRSINSQWICVPLRANESRYRGSWNFIIWRKSQRLWFFFYVRVVGSLAGKKLNIISNNIISTLIEDACRDNYLKVHRVIMYIEIEYVFLIDFFANID